jgi:hypothetical protein
VVDGAAARTLLASTTLAALLAAGCSSPGPEGAYGPRDASVDSARQPDASRDSSKDASIDARVPGVPPGVTASRSSPPVNPTCPQSVVIDKTGPPSTALYVYPRHPVRPFYQWLGDSGYCGEVSLIQAGMNNGQWMSQLNGRLVCGAAGNGRDADAGAPLLQSGPAGFCARHGNRPDYNSQLLLEDPAAANAPACLSNARLAYTSYDYEKQSAGVPGFEDYMAWVKAETFAGHVVTIGVFFNGGGDAQYDHIVTVISIGTNHALTDTAYHDDDVLYFDDHGVFTSSGGNPAIPPGAGGSSGCVPYVYGYPFGDLPRTRKGANAGSNLYSILIPGLVDTETETGGDGVGLGPPVIGHDYGFSVSGPADLDGTTLPVTVRIVTTSAAGRANPPDPVAGYDYENPNLGGALACTNAPPEAMSMTLEVTVDGLTPGRHYNLYEYDIPTVSGAGTARNTTVS